MRLPSRCPRFLLCAFLMLSASCAPVIPRETAFRQASERGFLPRLCDAPPFRLFTLHRQGKGETLTVYIEGDGHAWRNRTTPSDDPTPRNPVGLFLAVNDPSPNPVLYLARPGQYAREGQAARDNVWWTSARMSNEVITALNSAIDKTKALDGARKVALIGFSGGGGCAVLLAARRSDVVFLGTVAGNVNMAAWTDLHGVSPLSRSLDPIAAAPLVSGIPQRHLSGEDDANIPPRLSEEFCRAAGRPEACVTAKGMRHGGPWHTVWDYPQAAASE
ncbi:MAG: hypothetical protein J5838_04825 [Desulfovibrio sp.]|nr:hypothetical protein [Desulfovibrio sp.]